MNGDVLHEFRLQIERELFVEAFWIQVRIASDRTALPLIGELSRSQRNPLVHDRIVGDVTAIEADGLAVEVVGEGLIGGCGITQRTSGQINSAREIFVQLAFKSETHANPGAVAIGESGNVLEQALAAQPNVAIEAKTAKNILQCTDALVFVLGLGADQSQTAFGLAGAGACLGGEDLRFRGRLLRLSGCALCLVCARLNLSSGIAGPLTGVE